MLGAEPATKVVVSSFTLQAIVHHCVHARCPRYRKLYEDFKADYVHWKLVLMARKLSLAVVAVMLDKDPVTQVRLRLCNYECP